MDVADLVQPCQISKLLGREPDADNWSRVIVMRYPSRRHALALFCRPEYLPFAPYKLAALKVRLVPISAELVLSDLSVLFAGLSLLACLLVCWIRALRHGR
ncbi:MAG: hypothetical protein V4508_03460 [Pseudomonadota bacterium]